MFRPQLATAFLLVCILLPFACQSLQPTHGVRKKTFARLDGATVECIDFEEGTLVAREQLLLRSQIEIPIRSNVSVDAITHRIRANSIAVSDIETLNNVLCVLYGQNIITAEQYRQLITSKIAEPSGSHASAPSVPVETEDTQASATTASSSSIAQTHSAVPSTGSLHQRFFEKTYRIEVSGEGMFVLQRLAGSTAFASALLLQVDRDGYLTTEDSSRLQGRRIGLQSNAPKGSIGEISVFDTIIPPKGTGDWEEADGITVRANLDARAAIPRIGFDPTNVTEEMYNASVVVNIIDKKGLDRTIYIVFRRSPDKFPNFDHQSGRMIPGTSVHDRWEWYVLVSGTEMGAPPENLIAVGGGFLQFTDQGVLSDVTSGVFVPPSLAHRDADGTLVPPGPPVLDERRTSDPVVQRIALPYTMWPQIVGIQFGTPIEYGYVSAQSERPVGLDGVTQFASKFVLLEIKVGGRKYGTIEELSVRRNGVVVGRYDNGLTMKLFRIVLAKVERPQGLWTADDGLLEETTRTGIVGYGFPGESGFGFLTVVQSR